MSTHSKEYSNVINNARRQLPDSLKKFMLVASMSTFGYCFVFFLAFKYAQAHVEENFHSRKYSIKEISYTLEPESGDIRNESSTSKIKICNTSKDDLIVVSSRFDFFNTSDSPTNQVNFRTLTTKNDGMVSPEESTNQAAKVYRRVIIPVHFSTVFRVAKPGCVEFKTAFFTESEVTRYHSHYMIAMHYSLEK